MYLSQEFKIKKIMTRSKAAFDMSTLIESPEE